VNWKEPLGSDLALWEANAAAGLATADDSASQQDGATRGGAGLTFGLVSTQSLPNGNARAKCD
jgi:hypothetical protein